MEIPWWGLLYIIVVVFNACLIYIADDGEEDIGKWTYGVFIGCILMTSLYFQSIMQIWLIYSTYVLTLIIVSYTLYSFLEDILEAFKLKKTNVVDDEVEKGNSMSDLLIGYAVLLVTYVPGSILGI